jgi:hypothetical protein
MNLKLIKSELIINYESQMNIHVNKLHLSCESDVCDNEGMNAKMNELKMVDENIYIGPFPFLFQTLG